MRVKKIIKNLLYNSPLETSLNTKLRYEPIVRRLISLKRKNKRLKVLEVGSGSKGVTRFYKHPVIGMDVYFQDIGTKYLKKIKSSADSKFPFDDGKFDVVISVDTLEHIVKEKRKIMLSEMLRVSSKYILLPCPVSITNWDKKVLRNWPVDSPTYKNIKEHEDLGIPTPGEIEGNLSGCRYVKTYGQSSKLAYYIKYLERNLLGKLFARTFLKLLYPLLLKFTSKSRVVYFVVKN